MKTIQKLTFALIIFSLIFSISCSKDDDATIEIIDVEFSFDATNPPISQTLINNLLATTDANASLIGSQLSVANLMSVWFYLFDQPEGAAQSNVPVGTCGGNALVYTYTMSEQGEIFSVAFQICETSSKYTFQIFFSENGSPFELFLYAEESKTELKQGYMELYTSDLSESSISSNVILKYTWNENADGSFDFVVEDSEGDFKLTIELGADESGSMEIEQSGSIYYQATWNSTGTAGTYAYYDSEGNVTDSGNWPS
ncbi:hypothetical protein [Ekhidna sp.]|uniref:hypothetical protein n=1 Tax=Ekhidna sp. TaxID=2608089 RepID=UPI003516C0CE